MAGDQSIQEAIAALAATHDAFMAGDAAPFSARWSQGDDVTIFGGFGAYERGWDVVGPRMAWAASRFAGGHTDFEPIAMGSSGDLGYAIGLERGEAILAGQTEAQPLVLRVTHLFRREAGEWKLIHRHADPLPAKTAPAEIVQQ